MTPAMLEPFPEAPPPDTGGYFTRVGARLRQADSVGWSAESPAKLLIEGGKHTWSLGAAADAITLARHAAPGDGQAATADLMTLAARAEGRPVWGVLRGDVDNFGVRARRLQTIEEHVQLSVLYKQFFAGELEVGCSMPEFWRKVTVLYSGGDDFAVFGAWDALLLLGRELQRLFHRFCETSLKDLPGPEGKTISMALALADSAGTGFREVYEQCGRYLEIAKSADKDCFYVFGRTVEWKHLTHAAEVKDTLVRMISEFGCPEQLLGEVSGFYLEAAGAATGRTRRPWRYHRRLNLVTGAAKNREFQKVRSNLITGLIGKNATQVKLRPAGRVAVEWAKLLIEA